jgi:hypothetical protein
VDLASALSDLATDTSSEAQARLYAALTQARLEVGVDAGALLVERLADGRPAVLAFSGAAARRRFADPLEVVEVDAQEAFAGILAGGVEAIVIDPGGPVRVELGSWELRRLAAGELPDPDAPPERDHQLAIEPAGPLPDAFVATVREACAQRPEVVRAAVYEADPVRGQRHLLVALQSDGGGAPPAAELHEQLAARAPDGAVLTYAALVDAEPFASTARAATVYERSG